MASSTKRHTQLPKPTGNATFGEENAGEETRAEAKVEEEQGGLAFLDHVVCSICSAYLSEEVDSGRLFWMTSCGHIICNDPAHKNKKGICTYCSKPMEGIQIAQGLQPEHELWFKDTRVTARETLGQTRKCAQASLDFAAAFKADEKMIHVLRFQNSTLARDNLRLRAERKKDQNEIATQSATNDELHFLVAELKETVRKLSSSSQPIPTTLHPRMTNNSYAHGVTLPTVQEEPYDAPGEYAAQYGGGLGVMQEGSTTLGKRQRIDLAEQHPHRFVPPTPARGGPSRFATPQPVRHLSTDPYTPMTRSHSVAPPSADNGIGIDPEGVARRLAKYRFAPNAPVPSTPQRPLEPRFDREAIFSGTPVAQPRFDSVQTQMLPPLPDNPQRPSWLKQRGAGEEVHGPVTDHYRSHSVPTNPIQTSQAHLTPSQERRSNSQTLNHRLGTPQQFRPASHTQYDQNSIPEHARNPIVQPGVHIARQDRF